MPVATFHSFFWSKASIAALDRTGISADGLEAATMHLDGIYIPNKIVFYAVHHGDHLSGVPHQFGSNSLSPEGQMQGEELRTLFDHRSYGPVFHATTRPSHITASLLSHDRQQRLYGIEDWDLKRESVEQFRDRITRVLRCIERLGRVDAPPVLVVGRGVLDIITRKYSGPKVQRGGAIAVRYHERSNRLLAEAVYRPVEERSCLEPRGR